VCEAAAIVDQVELSLGGAGRNRARPQAAIDQSSCNKDYSCVNGFCPSFVTVHGGSLRKPTQGKRDAARFADLPDPPLAGDRRALRHPGHVSAAPGVGDDRCPARHGAHLEGKGVAVLDMTAWRQKGRRRLQPRPHRQPTRGHPCRAHRRRRRDL